MSREFNAKTTKEHFFRYQSLPNHPDKWFCLNRELEMNLGDTLVIRFTDGISLMRLESVTDGVCRFRIEKEDVS